MNEVPRSPATQQITQARRESNMATARLEHALLQTIINHVAEEHLTREQIVMALINVSGYWQKKILLAAVSKQLRESQ
jgi:hypothetical protein